MSSTDREPIIGFMDALVRCVSHLWVAVTQARRKGAAELCMDASTGYVGYQACCVHSAAICEVTFERRQRRHVGNDEHSRCTAPRGARGRVRVPWLAPGFHSDYACEAFAQDNGFFTLETLRARTRTSAPGGLVGVLARAPFAFSARWKPGNSGSPCFPQRRHRLQGCCRLSES